MDCASLKLRRYRVEGESADPDPGLDLNALYAFIAALATCWSSTKLSPSYLQADSASEKT